MVPGHPNGVPNWLCRGNRSGGECWEEPEVMDRVEMLFVAFWDAYDRQVEVLDIDGGAQMIGEQQLNSV